MQTLSRGVAAWLGGFCLMNLMLAAQSGFDANVWWLDVRALPTPPRVAVLATLGLLLLSYGVQPAMGPARRSATSVAVALAVLAATLNAAVFFALVASGRIESTLPAPLPLSAFVAGGLALVLREIWRGQASSDNAWRRSGVVCVVAALSVVFPLAQMLFYGWTDYRRGAQAVVVFGARAYADGRPSHALADRVRTACDLYHQGCAPLLIMSGGPGDGAVHETHAMRNLAMELGVPDRAILLDPSGLSTRDTVVHTRSMLRRMNVSRVLAVSHAYHLPRVKFEFERHGITAYTVPARTRYVLTKMPLLAAREVVAMWFYYVRPIADA